LYFFNIFIDIVSPNTQRVRIQIKGKKEEANFYLPISPLTYIIDPNRWAILYLTTKRILGKPWGEFDVTWEVKLSTFKRDENRKDFEFNADEIFGPENKGTNLQTGGSAVGSKSSNFFLIKK